MKYLNEFLLVAVVLFSILFLDLTRARAQDVCPKERTAFARGDSKQIEYWRVEHISDNCIKAGKASSGFINDVSTTPPTPKVITVAYPNDLILCQKDGFYQASVGKKIYQFYAHCRPGGEGHHLEVTVNGAKKVYEAATWQQLKSTFKLN